MSTHFIRHIYILFDLLKKSRFFNGTNARINMVLQII